jgi:hypothetical protein
MRSDGMPASSNRILGSRLEGFCLGRSLALLDKLKPSPEPASQRKSHLDDESDSLIINCTEEDSNDSAANAFVKIFLEAYIEVEAWPSDNKHVARATRDGCALLIGIQASMAS